MPGRDSIKNPRYTGLGRLAKVEVSLVCKAGTSMAGRHVDCVGRSVTFCTGGSLSSKVTQPWGQSNQARGEPGECFERTWSECLVVVSCLRRRRRRREQLSSTFTQRPGGRATVLERGGAERWSCLGRRVLGRSVCLSVCLSASV